MTIFRAAAPALAGGGLYALTELLWRGRTHWSMAALGGICFWLLGGLDELAPSAPLAVQAMLGGALVTVLEALTGLIVNRGYAVWDYRAVPGNLNGQICLPFSAAWIVVSAAAILLDDWLRWQLYGEDKPHYRWI